MKVNYFYSGELISDGKPYKFFSGIRECVKGVSIKEVHRKIIVSHMQDTCGYAVLTVFNKVD